MIKKFVWGSKIRKIDAGLYILPKTTQISSPHISGDKQRSTPLKGKPRVERFRYKCQKCKIRLERTHKEIDALKHPSLCQGCVLSLHRSKPTVSPERIIRLAKSGKFTTQQCVADEVGLSRERVRQVLKREKVRFGQQRGSDLIWPCPDCDETITLSYGNRNKWGHMPAHCRRCADGYCYRGHKKNTKNTYINANGSHTCRVCARIKAQRIVRYRICIDCKKEIPVTYNSDRTAKSLGNKLERCQSCTGRYAATIVGHKTQTHCKRGHLFDEKNTYHWKGTRHCRACIRIREHIRKAKKKDTWGERDEN